MGKKYLNPVFTYAVTANGQTSKKIFPLDNNVKKVKKVIMSSDNPALLYLRGSFELRIDGKVIYPSGYPAKAVVGNSSIPADFRGVKINGDEGVDSGNLNIDFTYQDTDTALAAFAAYNVYLLFECEE